jgi:NADPH:quinone reductase-like Zn-dependent oxidoreductase
MTDTMQAWVISEPGGPERLELREIVRPTPRDGWVLIKNRAFGLNRSEWFTRRGDSPSVRFPRVLGIECAGEVVAAPGTSVPIGQHVVAMMGGMGRQFDGSYAEYVLVPERSVFPVHTSLPWNRLAALPEMLQTVHGSLHVGLEIERANNLLVRGATSSIGFAAIALARSAGLEVTATTRSPAKADELKTAGATHVIVDGGVIADQARALYPDGFDRVLELIGTTTLLDSLQATRRGGIVCMTGILGGSWVLRDFQPMGDVPTGVKLTSYAGEAADMTTTQLQRYVALVESGALDLKLGPTFPFQNLREAHVLMDENRANGKMVVQIDG